jgi:hypothetical protein
MKVRTIGTAAVIALVVLAGIALSGPGTVMQAQGNPTCANVFGSGILVHGQHIVGDYVTGVGAVLDPDADPTTRLEWPPAGQVGQVVGANGGAVTPGGPGPAFHYMEGLPPGASFCLEQAHPNEFEIPGPHGG